MNTRCGKRWTRKFLYDNFTKSFLSGPYKVHRENVLLERQRALLPDTQTYVEELVRKERYRSRQKEIHHNIKLLKANVERLILEGKAEEVVELKLRIRKEMNESRNNIQQFQYPDTHLEQQPVAEVKQRRQFIKPCGVDSCRGFLSTQWKCGMCETWACPDCHSIIGKSKDDPHTCDPNDVETAKMVQKETRPCPTCHVPIHKLDGCDQMWCTQCHTAFSWKTGAIQTSIHNPHFYEWQRKNGGAPRVAGDVECGQELNHTTFDHFRNAILKGKHKRFLNYCDPNSIDGYDWTARHHSLKVNANGLSDIIRRTIHNERIELPQFRTDHLEKNQELRVQYLCNEIDEDTFKILVQRNDKKHRKNNEISQVIQVSVTAVTDIVFRIIDNLKNSVCGEDKFDELMGEFNGVREYCNEIFKDISFAYGCVQYALNDQMILRSVEKVKKTKKAVEVDEEE